MKKLFFLTLVLIASNAFSYDSTKLHIRLKIMNPAMWPTTNNSNAISISGDTAFQSWLVKHKVTKLEKVFSSYYDTISDFKYKYMLFHDSDAFVLAGDLDSMAGIKEVFIYDFIPYSNIIPNCTSSFTPNDPFTTNGVDLKHVSHNRYGADSIAYPLTEVDLTWHLDRIDAECAWDITKGNPNIVIGIVDTYMDTFHEDMRHKFKYWRHWNAEAFNPILESVKDISGDIGDNIVPANWYTHGQAISTFYHGMMCAGAAATSFNNSLGIAGVGGNCKLAGYSFLGYGPTGSNTTIEGWTDLDKAVIMAIEDGVKVINCSWGPAIGPAYYYLDDANALQVKYRAGFLLDSIVKYGISKGVVFTMAGGNNSRFNNQFVTLPSSQFVQAEGAIVVGGSYIQGPNNSSHVDRLFPEYNHAQYIDVCAPLGYATTKMQYNPKYPGLHSTGTSPNDTVREQNNKYTLGTGFSGTSSSSALVAGIVGLMFSANPYLSPAAVECLLKAGCEPMDYNGYENGQLVTIPSNHLGAGRVNAYNSVWLAKGESGSKYGSHTWNELRHIASDVTLESGCTLTISHNILISPYRKIIVKPGAKLIVDGAILTNLCGDRPWGGIVVLGDSSKSQLPETNQGVVELKNGAIIENAINGVRAIGWNTNGTINPRTTGGIIKAINSTFRNNTTDVVIWGKTISSLGKTQANVSYLKKCNFYTTDDIKISSLKEHINLTWCNNINMQGLKFHDQRTGVNPKTQGRIGINSAEASFNLFAYNNGVDTITPNRFANLKQAIRAVSVPADSRTLITKCTTASYKGFYVYKNPFVRAIDNQFAIKDDQYISDVTNYPYGLYIDKTPVFDVEGNVYHGTRTNSTQKGGHGGLLIRNTGANTATFYRGYFDNLSVASEAIGENKDGNDKERGVKFRCNEYANDIKDLQVLIEPTVNITAPSGMAEQQGSIASPADNLFGNASAVLNFNIDNEVRTGMTYYHPVHTISRVVPSRIVNVGLKEISINERACDDNLVKSGTGWPVDKRGDLALYKTVLVPVNTAWKAAIDHGNSPSNVVNDIETATTLNATLIYDQLMSYSPWLSMEALGKLAAKESVFSNAQIRNVLVANPQAGRSGWISSILDNRSGLLDPTDIEAILEAGDSLTNRDTMAWEVAEINTQYDLLLNDLIGWYLDDTLDNLATLDTLLTHPYNPMYRYQLASIYFERGLFTDYQNVLDSIPTQMDLSDEEVEYHTVFNDLYDKIEEWKENEVPLPILDSSQLSWLNTFYTEHPDMPGIGHALLAINDTAYTTTDPVYITDTSVYEGGEPFVSKTNSVKEEKLAKLLKVYPNPTTRQITFEWTGSNIKSKNTQVIITDEMGKTVMIKTWPVSQMILKIDLQGLPVGIYYGQLTIDNKLLETHKIMLSK